MKNRVIKHKCDPKFLLTAFIQCYLLGLESHWEEKGGEVDEVRGKRHIPSTLSEIQKFGEGVLLKLHFLCRGDLIFKRIIASEW